MPKVFIDTNVLIYSYDNSQKEKQKISRKRLSDLEDAGNGVISTQIIQEFYVAAIKKLKMDPILAKQIVAKFDNFEVMTVDQILINEAIDCSILNQMSFWDGLVIVAAHYAKCEKVWTEDLNDGQIIKNIKVENIFK